MKPITLNVQTVRDLSQKESILADIISVVLDSYDSGKWFIETEQIIEIIQMSREEYYRTLYIFRNNPNYTKHSKGFHEHEAEYFCLILGYLLNIDFIENSFFKAGLLYKEVHYKELEVSFVNLIGEIFNLHKLDKDLLLLLSSATLNYHDAFDSYFDSKFDIELIQRKVVESFLIKHSINNDYHTDSVLNEYLSNQLRNGKISFKEITLEYRLRYYYELYGREYSSQKKVQVSREFAELLRFFQLKKIPTKEELKQRYKSLLKQYHPDINKNGLEKTKVIIQKYKELSNHLENYNTK